MMAVDLDLRLHGPPRPAIALAPFQPAMAELAARAAAVDIRAFERLDRQRIDEELHPFTTRILAEAIALLDKILAACEHGDGGQSGDEDLGELARVLDLGAETASSHEAVEELAFVAQLELRQRQTRVSHAQRGSDLLNRLVEHESALRRIERALGALDHAIARFEHVPSLLDHTPLLQTSLAVRRAYARFALVVANAGPPTTTELRPRLRQLGTQIAVMIGWDIYPSLRVQDRLVLRQLQDRVLAWMRSPDADPADGVRIWSDLASCVEMFQQVRNRQELREHDQVTVVALTAQLERLPADEPLPAETWARLQTLIGVDPGCDPTLLERQPVSGATARGLVARLSACIEPVGWSPRA